jgi:NADPH:quinone reductase-like Zn-dependent oxidoreductase
MSIVIRFHRLGGPEVLQIEERDLPCPGPGEVLLKIDAIGLNRADAMYRTGQYLQHATLPSMLGFEAAATVLSCGPGAARFAPGDEVGVVPGFELGGYGTYAEHAVLPESCLLRQPTGITTPQAAALWMAYLTAYGGLIEAGKLQAGDFVAITAASSSVGLAAIQTARQYGARPIALTLGSAKRRALVEAGAEEVIATTEEVLSERLLTLTGGAGVRCVFDAVGGHQTAALAQCMARYGVLVVHGALSTEATHFPVKLALRNSLSFRGFVYTEITSNAAALARAHASIAAGIHAGVLSPVIDRIFNLSEVVQAHHYLESNQQFGKIVMTTEDLTATPPSRRLALVGGRQT